MLVTEIAVDSRRFSLSGYEINTETHEWSLERLLMIFRLKASNKIPQNSLHVEQYEQKGLSCI